MSKGKEKSLNDAAGDSTTPVVPGRSIPPVEQHEAGVPREKAREKSPAVQEQSPRDQSQQKAPGLMELIRDWIFRRYGWIGLIFLTILSLGLTGWWNWEKTKNRPG